MTMSPILMRLLQYIEAGTKYPSFCRRSFQMHFFVEENLCNQYTLKCVFEGPVDKTTSLSPQWHGAE